MKKRMIFLFEYNLRDVCFGRDPHVGLNALGMWIPSENLMQRCGVAVLICQTSASLNKRAEA
jgi:hypothetical protein